MRNLDFSTLVPTRDTFTDTDKKVYEFKAKVDFGIVDLARMKRLQSDLDTALTALATTPDDEAQAARFEQCADEIVATILPTLPETRRLALSVGQKAAIVKWWSEKEETAPDPKAPTPTPTP